MRWQDMRRSTNVIDMRGAPGGGGRGGRGRGARLGVGGTMAVVLVAWALGADPLVVLNTLLGGGAGAPTSSTTPSGPRSAEQDRAADFVSAILGDTEDTWTQIFAQHRLTYVTPSLVLFRDGVDSACGFQSSAVGPFYCPGDRRAYLDLAFFDELHARYGAPGDFAQAYVVAHEIGHHVQTLRGTSVQAEARRLGVGVEGDNGAAVRFELQADCLAGVWGHHAAARGLIEPGDLNEALTAASSIGDDTLQRNAGRRVAPDAFTHGTSEQRMRWFRRGFDTGSMVECDTFSAAAL